MTNLVVNGGFETGSLFPWTGINGNVINSPVQSGQYSCLLSQFANITQTNIPTQPSSYYELTFYATYSASPVPGEIFVTINGSTTQVNYPYIPIFVFTQFTIPFSTSDTTLSTTLTFETSDSQPIIDTISIVEVAKPSFIVTNTNDSGPGSLRQAIINANNDINQSIESVVEINVPGTINLTSGEIIITANIITIKKTVTDPVIINGSNLSRIFKIATDDIIVNISGITIENGYAAITDTFGMCGGGLFLSGTNSALTLESCVFNNNNVISDATLNSYGGAICCINYSTLNINNCIFSENRVESLSNTSNGGAIYIEGLNTSNTYINNTVIQNNISSASANSGTGGGMTNIDGNLKINNTTMKDNLSNGDGGGLYSVNTKTMQMFNTTISNNISDRRGGGAFIRETKIIINCTFNGNQSTNSGALDVYNETTLIGSTISNNFYISGNFGGGLSSNGSITNIGNTVIALNPTSSIPDVRAFADSINSLGYNFIGNADMTGSMFTSVGDQVNGDPRLSVLGNYGGPTETMIPLSIPLSPLIGTGGIDNVTNFYIYPEVLNEGIPIDQRGFQRIINGAVDIGSTEAGTIVCFSGDSLILTRNIQTEKIESVYAKLIDSTIHEVYDTVEKKFIAVKHNIVNGPVIRMIQIPKDSIKQNEPNEDFYVTGGHKILINGIQVKARKVPQGKKVKVKTQNVYTICTEKETAILINGLAVMTWSEEKFKEYAKKQNIHWK